MTVIPCDYWSNADGGCSNCPAAYDSYDCVPAPIEKEDLIQNLEEVKENFQKMLDRLYKL